MASHGSHEVAIADAIADVAVSARKVVVDRIDLLLLQARHGARDFALTLSMIGLALIVIGIALLAACATVAVVLSHWIGWGAALAVVTGISLVSSAWLVALVKRRLVPVPTQDNPSLPPSEPDPHKALSDG